MSATGVGPSGASTEALPAEGWGPAAWKALLILLLSFLGFVIVPDRLVSYLSLHVAPRTRDALATLWWVASFVFLSWLFVRLQRGRTA